MISELQLRLLPQQAFDERHIAEHIARERGLDVRTICHVRVLRRSIDARQRTVYVNLTVRAYVGERPADEAFEPTEYPCVDGRPQAVVVGAGPGGLFAALRLIELGVRPVVIERGKDVHERKRDLALITRSQKVDAESNYCFGEGGAGAYSDGKLYTRSKKRGSVEKILRVFCQHGAPLAILADAHPHIGTDRLPGVIERMRETIRGCGGEVRFQTRMTSLILRAGRVEGVRATDTARSREVEVMGPVIMATGHSARDVYRYLSEAGVGLEAKGIAVGVRLEHPAELIDRIQYHNPQGRGRWLPAAEYSFVTQVESRGVYSFCMCPGGFVIPAATGPGQLVVNGMSPASRGTRWSNSGMVVELRADDVEGGDALRVMRYQERLEHTCWQHAGMRQTAPAQRMTDFCEGRASHDLPATSYAPGVVASPLHQWMPAPVASRLQAGFRLFGQHARGFLTAEAALIAVETRTSAPVRVVRDTLTLEAAATPGLFPCGEGAGYAGGIVSAAVDGERCAERCAEYLSR